MYSRLSLTQLCYHLSRTDGPVPVFSLILNRWPGPGIFPYVLLQFHNVYLNNGLVNKTDNSLRKTGPADQF